MRALRTFVLVVVMLAVTAPSAAAGRTPGERMVDKLNKVRDRHGLRRLRAAPKLVDSSRGYARHLIRIDSFGHGNSYRRAGFRKSGEILALRRGRSRRPRPAVRMWMHSPGHRSLILSPSFRYVGAAPARGRFGGAPTTIWVVHFGAH